MRIASHPHYDSQGQKSNFDAIQKIGSIGSTKRRKSSFDMADSDTTRLRMIGGEIRSQGDRWDDWVLSHPRQMAWLKQSGKTLDDCRQAFDEWWEESMSDECDESEGTVAGIGS